MKHTYIGPHAQFFLLSFFFFFSVSSSFFFLLSSFLFLRVCTGLLVVRLVLRCILVLFVLCLHLFISTRFSFSCSLFFSFPASVRSRFHSFSFFSSILVVPFGRAAMVRVRGVAAAAARRAITGSARRRKRAIAQRGEMNGRMCQPAAKLNDFGLFLFLSLVVASLCLLTFTCTCPLFSPLLNGLSCMHMSFFS